MYRATFLYSINAGMDDWASLQSTAKKSNTEERKTSDTASSSSSWKWTAIYYGIEILIVYFVLLFIAPVAWRYDTPEDRIAFHRDECWVYKPLVLYSMLVVFFFASVPLLKEAFVIF